MPEINELPDPAKLLKKVLAEAQFENTDIGGAVFSLLDSLSYDFTSNGWEHSDATEDLMQEVVNILAKDYDEIRTDDVDEEEEDEVPDITVDEEVEEESDEVDAVELVATLAELSPEEIDEVPYLEDTTDLEEEVPNGQGNQEVANKG